MNRSDYWLRICLMFVGVFFVGFIFGFTGTYIPPDLDEVITIGVTVYLWYIGYKRCQDAGVHGLWAIFTPTLIGLFIIGCLRTNTVRILDGR